MGIVLLPSNILKIMKTGLTISVIIIAIGIAFWLITSAIIWPGSGIPQIGMGIVVIGIAGNIITFVREYFD